MGLEVVQQMRARVAVLVGGRYDRAAFPTDLVGLPSDFVFLAPYLHRALVLVPGANAPDRVASSQLVAQVIDVFQVVWPLRYGSDPREDEEQAPEGACGLHAKVTAARGVGDPAEPLLQPVLIALGAVPAVIVIAHRDENREIGAEDRGDHRVPGDRVVLVIQISEMEHEIGVLRLDHLQDGAGFLGQALVADEGDGHRLQRTGRRRALGFCLCLARSGHRRRGPRQVPPARSCGRSP